MIDKDFNEFDEFDFYTSEDDSDNVIEEFFALCDDTKESWRKDFSYTSYKCKDVMYLIPKAEHSARLSIGRDLGHLSPLYLSKVYTALSAYFHTRYLHFYGTNFSMRLKIH